VWLVDHAWTFVASQKPSRQLARHPSLLQRMAALVGMESNPNPEPAAVLRALWPHANMYRLSGAPGYPSDEAIWYVMDEFGTRIGHAGGGDDDGVEEGGPTLGMAPFYFQPEACMYSVLWALLDMDCGDEATRGRYAHGVQRCRGRKSDWNPLGTTQTSCRTSGTRTCARASWWPFSLTPPCRRA